jgi:streptomycin 6-kinase
MTAVESVEVPPMVQVRARMLGASGERWIRDLPEVLAALGERWNVTVGRPFAGGTSSYVAEAVDGDGRQCVVKVPVPFEGTIASFERTVLVHELAAGVGCVELLAHDTEHQALLLERLGPNLADLERSVPEIVDTVADALATFWRPIGAHPGLPSMVDQATWLADYIVKTWEALRRPCARDVIDRAVELCEQGAARFDPSNAVLVHGDAHGWNTLASMNGGEHKLVDPEGLCAEREYDLSVVMREYNDVLLAGDTPRLVRGRAERLARRTGADVDRIEAWGFVERVSTGLASMANLAGTDDFLVVAARCL